MRLLFLLFIVLPIITQGQKQYQAQTVSLKPKIDGKPNDACWNNLAVGVDFIQTVPNPLAPSKYKTEFKICYDNDAIYFLGIMHQPNATILKQLCERDRIGNTNVDNIAIFFDTYNDKQNGFAFKVTAAGVQQDERLSNGGSANGFGGSDDADVNWDAVWNSATSIDSDKWFVEIEIPFSALRIPNASSQSWGFNIRRSMRKDNETSFWAPIDPNKQGFLLQAGQLQGIENIKTPLRLFLFPYLSGGYQSIPNNNGSRSNQFLPNGGMDIKYGINDAFTLDMTLIPDFSQVISDNLIRNLSPFEQQLTENRPFFTEGVELFNKQGLFYSRRIGERPDAFYNIENTFGNSADYKIIQNPNVSRLYNSFKISGRTKGNLGIGIINALQAPTYADIKKVANDSSFSIKTGSLTNYNILVLDKAYNGQNNFNFTNTAVVRADNGRFADVFGVQSSTFYKDNTYNLFASYNQSNILENDHWKIGSLGNLNFSKVSGRLQYGIETEYFSKQFDQTDASIQFDYNTTSQSLFCNYQQIKPKNEKLQTYRYFTKHTFSQNLSPYKFKFYDYEVGAFFLWKNFWDITFYTGGKPFGEKDFYQLERFNTALNNYGYNYFSFEGSSDSRKRKFIYYSASYGNNFIKNNLSYTDFKLGFRYIFNDHLNAETSFGGVLNHASTGRTEEYYSIDSAIISYRNVHEYTWDVKFAYNINPNMNINARYRHYNNTLKNNAFYLADDNKKWDAIPLPFRNGLNENFNLSNVDFFYNWIFTPGSRFVLSYKQWLPNGYILNNQYGSNNFTNNVYESWEASKAWALTARVIWFLDYNKLKSFPHKKP
jgi:hypothetical protein